MKKPPSWHHDKLPLGLAGLCAGLLGGVAHGDPRFFEKVERVTGKEIRPFDHEAKVQPATALTDANRELLKQLTLKAATPGKALALNLIEGLPTETAITPALAQFQGDELAGRLTKSLEGQLEFRTVKGAETLRLKNDARLDRIPDGFAISFAVESVDGSGPPAAPGADAQISGDADGLVPFAVKHWQGSLQSPLGDRAQRYQPISESAEKYKDAFQELVKEAPSLEDSLTLQQELEKRGEEFIRSIGHQFSTETDPAKKVSLSRTAALVEVDLKAVQGTHIDNFDPEIYERIPPSSRACGAISFGAEREPIISAILISSDGILTCSHNAVVKWDMYKEMALDAEGKTQLEDLSEARRSRLAFFIPDRERRGGRQSDGAKIPITKLEYSGVSESEDGLVDFALFRLKPGALAAYEDAQRQATPPGKIYEPIRPPAMAETFPPYQSPLIVIGHPKGQRKLIHDNAHVIYPPVANTEDWNRIEMAQSNARSHLRTGAEQAERLELWNEFVAAYYRPRPSGLRYYHLKMPVFGLDSDTFHGDSGAPVLDRLTGNIVGVFRGSVRIIPREENISPEARFVEEGKPPDFDHHEIAVPITEIIKRLDQMTDRKWRDDFPGCRFADAADNP